MVTLEKSSQHDLQTEGAVIRTAIGVDHDSTFPTFSSSNCSCARSPVSHSSALSLESNKEAWPNHFHFIGSCCNDLFSFQNSKMLLFSCIHKASAVAAYNLNDQARHVLLE